MYSSSIPKEHDAFFRRLYWDSRCFQTSCRGSQSCSRRFLTCRKRSLTVSWHSPACCQRFLILRYVVGAPWCFPCCHQTFNVYLDCSLALSGAAQCHRLSPVHSGIWPPSDSGLTISRPPRGWQRQKSMLLMAGEHFSILFEILYTSRYLGCSGSVDVGGNWAAVTCFLHVDIKKSVDWCLLIALLHVFGWG